jgi:hypothetical protein
VQMKNQIGWLAFLTVLVYEVIQLMPPLGFQSHCRVHSIGSLGQLTKC